MVQGSGRGERERECRAGGALFFFWGRDSAFVEGKGRRKEEAGEEEEERRGGGEREREKQRGGGGGGGERERVDEGTGVVAVADSCRLPERAAKKHPGSSDSLPD